MTIDVQTEFGHSLQPEGPHTVTFHMPGWDIATKFRRGSDLGSLISRLKSVYPRLFPFGPAAAVRIEGGESVEAFVATWRRSADHNVPVASEGGFAEDQHPGGPHHLRFSLARRLGFE